MTNQKLSVSINADGFKTALAYLKAGLDTGVLHAAEYEAACKSLFANVRTYIEVKILGWVQGDK